MINSIAPTWFFASNDQRQLKQVTEKTETANKIEL
jgi:hypothetical protein